MNDRSTTTRSSDELAKVHDLIEEFRRQASQDDSVSPQEFAARYPEHQDLLLRLLPAAQVLSELSSMATGTSAGAASHFVLDAETLGDFRILKEIGRGGMGVVYEAEQISLERPVALKILPMVGILDEHRLKRFRNEARAAAMLKHPNIVSVHAVGSERGVHFYAMELIEGKSLADVVAMMIGKEKAARSRGQGAGSEEQGTTSKDELESPPCNESSSPGPSSLLRDPSSSLLDPSPDTSPLARLSTEHSHDRKSFHRSVARLGIQAAHALHYAHGEGVIHRDIKPSNLLLDNDGVLHITDFGLARIQEGDNLTMTGDVVGTLRYMSPEQVDASATVDHRADICSLGLTLYELVTGRPAFAARHRQELISQVQDAVPVRPSRLDKEVPPDLETIILKSIEKAPSARYKSADEMAQDLQRFVDNRPITARRISRAERTLRWARRNRLLAALVSSIAILLVALTIGSSAFAWKLLQDAQEKDRTARLQQIGIFARDMQLVQQSVRDGNYIEAEQQLLKWVPANGGEDHRGFEWYHLWKACHDPAIEQSISYQLMTHDLTFTDENTLAVAWFSNEVSVWDLSQSGRSRLVRQLVNPQQEIYVVRALPGIDRLVVGDTDGRVIEWNMMTAEKEQIIELGYPTSTNKITWLATSANNEHVAISSSMKRVDVWNRTTKTFDKRLEGWDHQSIAAFTATGDLVVVGEQGGKLERFDHQTWSRVAELSLDADGALSLACSPDRGLLALATYALSGGHVTSTVDIWDTATWQRVARLPLRNSVARAMTFSPDGSMLVVGDDAGTLFLIDPKTQRFLGRRQGHPEKIVGVSFSPSGKRLATAGNDGNVHLWNVSDLLKPDQSVVRLKETAMWTWSAAFIDNRTAATTRNEGPVFLWDIQSGETIDRIVVDQPDANLVQLTLSNDRKLAAVACGHSPPQDQPSKVEFFDVQTRQSISSKVLPLSKYAAKSSFSPDNRLFALGGLDAVVILDVATAKVVHEIKRPEWLKGVIYTPDGHRLISFDFYGMVRVYDAGNYQLQHELKLDNEMVLRIAFSPDGKRMAIVGLENRVKLFDTQTFEPLPPQFPKLRRYLSDVTFSPDGKRIVTGGIDGKIRIWHAESGDELISFDVTQGFYPECCISPDGNSLLVGCGDMSAVFHTADRTHLSKLSLAELNDIGCRGATTEMKLKDEQDRKPKR